MMRSCKTEKGYWRASLVPILAFTLNMGLRWGRGTDYNTGYNVFEKIGVGLLNAEEYEPIWKFTIRFFRNFIDAPYQLFIIFCSFFLIFSFVYFIRNHKNVAHLALPIFAFLVFPSENLIRWFYAFSFILMGLFHLEKGRILKYVICSFLGFITHYGSLTFSLPILLVFLLLKKRVLFQPWLSTLIILLVFLFFDVSDMLLFSPLLTSIEVGGNLGNYQENMDATLTNDFGDYSGALTGTSLITSPLLLFLGYKIVRYRSGLIPYYNLMVIGLVSMPAFVQIQMLYRISLVFTIFQFLIFSYICYDYVVSKTAIPRVLHVISLILLLIMLRSMLVQPFVKDASETYYIWDAEGRKTL